MILPDSNSLVSLCRGKVTLRLDKLLKSGIVTRSIPVVILTSSEAEKDVVKSYNLHANSYIIKPMTLDQFSTVVTAVENFWFTVVVLPSDFSQSNH
jgi:response regulator RpfG family c-di-GMP phosphodiesterase